MKPAKQLFEERFAEINRSLNEQDYSLALLPLVDREAYLWLKSEQVTLQWVLEMMS